MLYEATRTVSVIGMTVASCELERSSSVRSESSQHEEELPPQEEHGREDVF